MSETLLTLLACAAAYGGGLVSCGLVLLIVRAVEKRKRKRGIVYIYQTHYEVRHK